MPHNTLIDFFISHWFLSTAFIGVAFLLLHDFIINADKHLAPIDTKKLVEIVNNKKNVLLIDLRSESLFKTGHITNAVNCPNIQKVSELIHDNNGQIFIFYDATGRQYSQLKKHLNPKDKNRFFVLKGGIKSWQDDALPTVHER